MRSAICVCVMFSKNRKRQDSLLALGQGSYQRTYGLEGDHLVEVGIEVAESVPDAPGIRRPAQAVMSVDNVV